MSDDYSDYYDSPRRITRSMTVCLNLGFILIQMKYKKCFCALDENWICCLRGSEAVGVAKSYSVVREKNYRGGGGKENKR
jgi:hypothetical protein